MTGQYAIDQAIKLLGYEGQYDTTGDERFTVSALAGLNMVYAELYHSVHQHGFIPLESSAGEIVGLPEAANEAVIAGTAAWIAQSVGDMNSQSIFAAKFNDSRRRAAGRSRIGDVVPRVVECYR